MCYEIKTFKPFSIAGHINFRCENSIYGWIKSRAEPFLQKFRYYRTIARQPGQEDLQTKIAHRHALLDNLADDAIASLFVTKFSTISLYLAKLFVIYCRALRHKAHTAKSAKTVLTVQDFRFSHHFTVKLPKKLTK